MLKEINTRENTCKNMSYGYEWTMMCVGRGSQSRYMTSNYAATEMFRRSDRSCQRDTTPRPVYLHVRIGHSVRGNRDSTIA